MGHYFARSGVK